MSNPCRASASDPCRASVSDPCRASVSDTRRTPRSKQRGQALIEVLAALVLFAMAGAVVASAAATNLRSLRAAGVRGRLVALAAREIARLQVLVTPGTHTEPFVDGAVHGAITGETTVNEEGTLATLTATAAAAPQGPQVRLITRVHLPW